jgi:uncharacterized protein YdaU (DUF1376 family)
MNFYDKHVGDYIRDTVSLTMLEDGAYNRLLDQLYQTERALPLDKKEVYRLARAANTIERKAVDYVLAKFFHTTDEGYMQKRAQVVIEEFWDRAPAAESKKENAKIRQQRTRERRKTLFDRLRDLGVTPEFNASMRTLEAELSRVTKQAQSQSGHATVTRDDTLTHFPLPTTQLPVTNRHADDDSTDSGAAASISDPEPDLPPVDDYAAPHSAPLPTREAPPLSNDPAIQIGVALRRMGVNAPFTHPAVQDWATKGIPLSMLTEAVAIARMSKGDGAKIPPNYLVPIVNDLLHPPAASPTNTPIAAPPARKPTGMDPKGLDESYDVYNARISKAEADRRKGQP